MDPPKLLRSEVLASDKLASLANKPGTTVLKYTSETPEAIMPAHQQQRIYKAIVQSFDAACRAYPHESNECIRERLLNARPEVRLFQRLYCKTFAMSTIRAQTDEEKDQLDQIRKTVLLMLHERVAASGNIDQEVASRVMNSCMRLAMRPARPEDLENATSLDGAKIEDEATGEVTDLPPITPIDHHTLGPTVVWQ
jgi:hypothetical protein